MIIANASDFGKEYGYTLSFTEDDGIDDDEILTYSYLINLDSGDPQ